MYNTIRELKKSKRNWETISLGLSLVAIYSFNFILLFSLCACPVCFLCDCIEKWTGGDKIEFQILSRENYIYVYFIQRPLFTYSRTQFRTVLLLCICTSSWYLETLDTIIIVWVVVNTSHYKRRWPLHEVYAYMF